MAGDRVWLDVSDVQLSEAEVEQLMRGLSQVAADIQTKRVELSITIKIIKAHYSPTDYQPEGLAAALIGWASEEFELDRSPRVDARFDAQTNRYVITLADD